MGKYIPFNLNQYVKVKIKPKGYEKMVADIKLLSFQTNGLIKARDLEYFKSKEDSEGYTTFQAHEFIYQFGHYSLDLPQLIDINILIQSDNDN